ncbi:MAG: hypothetical protein ACE5KT_11330 [Methanosarcinales archaeon]
MKVLKNMDKINKISVLIFIFIFFTGVAQAKTLVVCPSGCTYNTHSAHFCYLETPSFITSKDELLRSGIADGLKVFCT